VKATAWPEAQAIADLLCEAEGIAPVTVEMRYRRGGFWRWRNRLLVLPTGLAQCEEADRVGYIAHELSHAVAPPYDGGWRRQLHHLAQRRAEERLCRYWGLTPIWGKGRYALAYGPVVENKEEKSDQQR